MQERLAQRLIIYLRRYGVDDNVRFLERTRRLQLTDLRRQILVPPT